MSLIAEGTTENISQFIMPLNLIYNKNIFEINKNVFLIVIERLNQ